MTIEQCIAWLALHRARVDWTEGKWKTVALTIRVGDFELSAVWSLDEEGLTVSAQEFFVDTLRNMVTQFDAELKANNVT